MLGQQIGDLSILGLAFAFGAALCRVVSLLATRAKLGGTDARVTTWYSMVPSTVVFVAASLMVGRVAPATVNLGLGRFCERKPDEHVVHAADLHVHQHRRTISDCPDDEPGAAADLGFQHAASGGSSDVVANAGGGDDDRLTLRISVCAARGNPVCSWLVRTRSRSVTLGLRFRLDRIAAKASAGSTSRTGKPCPRSSSAHWSIPTRTSI